MSTSVRKEYAHFNYCKFNKVAIFNGIVLNQVACSSLPCTLSLYNAFMWTVSVKAGQKRTEARRTKEQTNKEKKKERTNTSRGLLKFTNRLWRTRRRWKQTHISAVLSYRTCVYFSCLRSGNALKCTVLGRHDHDLNTCRKQRFFKTHRSREGRNLMRFVFSAISKWRSALWFCPISTLSSSSYCLAWPLTWPVWPLIRQVVWKCGRRVGDTIEASIQSDV